MGDDGLTLSPEVVGSRILPESEQYGRANQTDYSSRFDLSGGQAWSIDTKGQSVTFASDLQGAGRSLSKSGTGTPTLTGDNAHDGAISVLGGSLDLGGAWTLGAAGTATTFAATGATLSGGGVISANTLAHSGGGTVRLTGPNLLDSLSTSGTMGNFTLTNAQSLAMGSLSSAGTMSVAGDSVTGGVWSGLWM